MSRPAQFKPSQPDRLEPTPGRIIIVERRHFLRGCLCCWLARYYGYHLAETVPDVQSLGVSASAPPCIASIIGMPDLWQDEWLARQIRVLRSTHAAIPIVLTVDTEHLNEVEELTTQLDLQGYIPAFTHPEVAAAAVHLVIAGGRYFPRSQPLEPLRDWRRRPVGSAAMESLTSRQRMVLGLLGSGMPNKMIAEQLGMSLSTVKVHVHHIIRKLKVGNRTEAALMTQQHTHTTGVTMAASAPVQDTC